LHNKWQVHGGAHWGKSFIGSFPDTVDIFTKIKALKNMPDSSFTENQATIGISSI